jgi:hypothetical protein
VGSTAAPEQPRQQRRSTRSDWLERESANPEPAHAPGECHAAQPQVSAVALRALRNLQRMAPAIQRTEKVRSVAAPPKLLLAATKKARRQLESPKVMVALERLRKAEAWRAELPPPEDPTLLSASEMGMLDTGRTASTPRARANLGCARPAAKRTTGRSSARGDPHLAEDDPPSEPPPPRRPPSQRPLALRRDFLRWVEDCQRALDAVVRGWR